MSNISELKLALTAVFEHEENIGEDSWVVAEELDCTLLAECDRKFIEAASPRCVQTLLDAIESLQAELEAAHREIQIRKECDEAMQNALSDALAEKDELRMQLETAKAALKQISEIPNREWGPDWEEIEEARAIATAALSTTKEKK